MRRLLCPVVLCAIRKTHKNLGTFYDVQNDPKQLDFVKWRFVPSVCYDVTFLMTPKFGVRIPSRQFPHVTAYNKTFSPTNPVVCKFAYSAGCVLEPLLVPSPQTPPQHCLCSPTSSGDTDFYQTRSFHLVKSVSSPPYLIYCSDLQEQLSLHYCI